MTEEALIDLGSKAIWITMLVAAPALLVTLVVGLVVSVIQAATQINEQTLSFIPKIVFMTIALVVCGPWILETMLGFTAALFRGIPSMIH